jgi:hypothetical protein
VRAAASRVAWFRLLGWLIGLHTAPGAMALAAGCTQTQALRQALPNLKGVDGSMRDVEATEPLIS